jgi:hypothetical protein
LPQGGPGCSLLASPDLIDILWPVAGSVTVQLAIPDAPILIA